MNNQRSLPNSIVRKKGRLSLSVIAWLLISSSSLPGQTNGTITGRVVTDDGGGLANVMVSARPVGASFSGVSRTVTTDEEGNFKFTGLVPSQYAVTVFGGQGYVRAPLTDAERNESRYYRIGDRVNFTLIKGGVITGRVIDADGQPIINVLVVPWLVRDAEGRQVNIQFGGQSRATDDRGVYRLYGLFPGSYLVMLNNSVFLGGQVSPYAGEAPTYYPSSGRETAAEVKVAAGGEVTGVDLRYRGERGRVISGVVKGGLSGSSSNSMPASVLSFTVPGRQQMGQANVQRDGSNGFEIVGLPDGDYELTARVGGFEGQEGFVSPPRRVTVKGSDVTGVELNLAPLASLVGNVIIESGAISCETKAKTNFQEIIVAARRSEPSNSETPASMFYTSAESALTEKGEFKFPFLNSMKYMLEARLPNENLYVKSIAAPIAAPTRRAAAGTGALNDISRTGVSLKSGDKLAGVKLVLAEGAAFLRGQVKSEREGATLPLRMRIYLVPSEPAAADDVLRYAETLMHADGSFTLRYVAPGKYWLLTRIVKDDEQIDRAFIPAAWESGERAKLRKEAEAKKIEIELKPCQRINDFALKY